LLHGQYDRLLGSGSKFWLRYLLLLLLLVRRTIMDDPFIRQYVEDLLRKIRTQVQLTSGC